MRHAKNIKTAEKKKSNSQIGDKQTSEVNIIWLENEIENNFIGFVKGFILFRIVVDAEPLILCCVWCFYNGTA